MAAASTSVRVLPDGGADDEERWLAEGIAGVQQNAFYMHRALVSPLRNYTPTSLPATAASFLGPCSNHAIWAQDSNNLKDALKYSAQMLSELRTSRLSPHKYYELCE
jgi:vacuolar protein sorting-associated protein 35